jgi:hypothetical protein
VRRRWRTTAAVIALGLVAVPVSPPGFDSVAHAHLGVPGVRAVLDEITPSLPDGVTVSVPAAAGGQVLVDDRAGVPIDVLDPDGRPFLRLGPNGAAVDAGTSAGAAAAPGLFADGRTETPASGGASGGAPADWRHVSTAAAWSWVDERLHARPLLVAPSSRAGAVVRLDAWRIDLTVADQAVVVRGHREYRRPRGAAAAAVDAASVPTGLRVDVAGSPLSTVVVDASGLRGEVVVVGVAGEPVLRIDAGSGGVEANEASPTWVARNGAPVGASGEAPPRWRRVALSRTYAWTDPRVTVPTGLLTDEVLADTRPRTVGTWSIPLRIDGVPATVVGTHRWVPDARLAPRFPAVEVVTAAAGAVAVLVALGVRRSANQASGRPPRTPRASHRWP